MPPVSSKCDDLSSSHNKRISSFSLRPDVADKHSVSQSQSPQVFSQDVIQLNARLSTLHARNQNSQLSRNISVSRKQHHRHGSIDDGKQRDAGTRLLTRLQLGREAVFGSQLNLLGANRQLQVGSGTIEQPTRPSLAKEMLAPTVDYSKAGWEYREERSQDRRKQ